MSNIKLGNLVKDIVTGFEGIAVSRIEYLDGTLDMGVRPKVSSDGKRPSIEYIGLEQLERIGDGILVKKAPKHLGFHQQENHND